MLLPRLAEALSQHPRLSAFTQDNCDLNKNKHEIKARTFLQLSQNDNECSQTILLPCAVDIQLVWLGRSWHGFSGFFVEVSMGLRHKG